MASFPSFDEFRAQLEQAGSRLIVLVPFGRGGVFFLQSLFDGHPQVLMYPGNFDFYNRVILREADWKSNWRRNLEEAFDVIPQAKHMNINTGLGEDGKGALNLDAKALLRFTEEAMVGQPMDSRTLFLAAHYAIARFMGKDLSAVTTLLLHDHHHPVSGETEEAIRADFPASQFLYTTKDPRSNYYSQRRVRKVLMASEGFEIKYQHFMTVTCIALYQHGLTMLNAFKGKAWIIRLEDVQAEKEIYLRALVAQLGIAFDPCLLQTTFGGMQWVGDAGSKKPEPGFRKSADPKLWSEGLSPVRVAALEILLKTEIEALGYPIVHGPRSIWHWVALVFLPLWKYEDFDELLSSDYYRYRLQINSPPWKVVLGDSALYLRTTLGLVKKLIRRAPRYPSIPNTVFRSA